MTLWYLARAAGLVALFAFTAATALGALATRRPRSIGSAGLDRRYLIQMAHRSAAITGLFALTLHVALLVTDSFVNVSVVGALVPLAAGYRPVAVALGTLGLYAIVVAAVSGASRGRLAGSARAAGTWRSVHVAAYAGWALSMAHGVLSGTDTGTWWSTASYLACGMLVAASVAARLLGGGTQGPLTTARSIQGRAS